MRNTQPFRPGQYSRMRAHKLIHRPKYTHFKVSSLHHRENEIRPLRTNELLSHYRHVSFSLGDSSRTPHTHARHAPISFLFLRVYEVFPCRRQSKTKNSRGSAVRTRTSLPHAFPHYLPEIGVHFEPCFFFPSLLFPIYTLVPFASSEMDT